MTLNPPHSPSHPHPIPNRRVLIVGNYCHDVLIQNGSIVAETLGGASFRVKDEVHRRKKQCNGHSCEHDEFHAHLTPARFQNSSLQPKLLLNGSCENHLLITNNAFLSFV
ncbi:hypothetical protein Bca101_001219 [Brassica carinata]